MVDGLPVEGTFRAHQVPLDQVRTQPEHLKMLQEWLETYDPMRCSIVKAGWYRNWQRLPQGDRRMGANPHANGGSCSSISRSPISVTTLSRSAAGRRNQESTRQLGELLRDIFTRNAAQANFRLFCPDEVNSNRLGAVFEVRTAVSWARIISIDDHVAPTGGCWKC